MAPDARESGRPEGPAALARLSALRPDTLGLPGPSALPMVAGVGRIRRDPLTFLREVQGRYGDTVAFPVPGAPYLLLNDPAAVRHVLVTNGRAWGKRTFQYEALAEVTRQGLLASWQPDWRTRRRAAQPAFHHGRVAGLVATMGDAAERALAGALAREGSTMAVSPGGGWHDLDVEALCLRLTLDIVGETLFGTDLSAQTAELVHATDEAAELIVARGQSTLPLPLAVPTPLNRRLRRVVATLDRLTREIITARRGSDQPDRGDDLLSLLIAAGLPDEAIRDELVTMVVAGHETVASGLAWALMLLAEHPGAQARVREEAAAGEAAEAASAPWTTAVVHETLRLYSPAWVITRRAVEADTAMAAIPSVGRTLPAGTTAIISPWLMHRGPGWPDPEEFRPQRWLPAQEGGEGVSPRRDDYLPFGQGARLCIGRDFALVEIAAVLQRILTRLELDVPPAWQRPAISAFVTMRPRGGLVLRAREVGAGAR